MSLLGSAHIVLPTLYRTVPCRSVLHEAVGAAAHDFIVHLARTYPAEVRSAVHAAVHWLSSTDVQLLSSTVSRSTLKNHALCGPCVRALVVYLFAISLHHCVPQSHALFRTCFALHLPQVRKVVDVFQIDGSSNFSPLLRAISDTNVSCTQKFGPDALQDVLGCCHLGLHC